MARFGVHELAGAGRVMNVQSDFLDRIETRLVVPPAPRTSAPPPAKHLDPVFKIDGAYFVFITQSMAAVPVSAPGPEVASLSERPDEITRALDMVFQGF